ncbi:lysophosphatidylserine lipase ABHD12-like isoform X3 [Plodia interpunctella]|uniref:lysophosphatidylserine lipase ABHD12-like isoform X3 n=1 Tax=Plodia interpunctella TaxID=58824 RepID=UPI0031018DC5
MIGTILMTGASVTASLFVVQVAVLPLVFKYSKCVQRKMVFSNCSTLNYPRNLDYENPASCNVIGGRNFSIQFTSKADQCPIKIGVWHIVPCCLFRDMFVIRDYTTIDPTLQIQLQRTRNPIVLYCHGNSNHRASPHRLQMYKVFQRLNFHVITFDYRGYGDSTPVRPTERGVVEDALCVYAWLIDSLDPENRPPVIIWGHSLGTAIASNLVANMARLCEEQGVPVLPQPAALVLEAPFNNLMEEIEKHPFSKVRPLDLKQMLIVPVGVLAAVLQGDLREAIQRLVGVLVHDGPVPDGRACAAHPHPARQGGQSCALRALC